MRIGYNRFETQQLGEKYGVIILAAGLSSRMQTFKPLLPVDGQSAIEGLIESAKVAGLNDIIVVTGHNKEALSHIIRNRQVTEAFNPHYEQGMFTSIKAGLSAAKALAAADKKSKQGWLLMPVDCPLISAKAMITLLLEANKNPEAFAVTTFEGKKGHPLYIPGEVIDEICEYQGDRGLKGITDKYQDQMVRVPVDEEGCILDMDTPEGYEDIKAFVAKGFRREKLELLTARKRIILLRHGETKQHEEPIFIGQYDVPLSKEGQEQAHRSATAIGELISEDIEAELMGMDKFGREPMPAIERIYCSDLSRARQTAEAVCEKVNRQLAMCGAGQQISVTDVAGLREMNLGEWDGQPIRKIREQWPEEYERRGRDKFVFKTGNTMENFYDMQYRVMATLREILRNDDAKNIIIVTHRGVIRALENNIKGLRVNDDWEDLKKGDFRILEPFPEQPSEKASGEKPMDLKDMTMEALLEYYN